ncbi:MAG TPA: Gfo/Idh/MocA family oxidoreductase [Candidatus Paceibacterota bacterium]|nr:Gfo/Idh/MocA family oxidoreductase [Candidatus Paceibacterota bacterium]
MKRRDFLRRSAAATAAIALPTFAPSGVFAAARRLGANDRIQVGFIGVGGRARWIMTKEELPGAQIVAVADCFLPRCDEAASKVAGGDRWKKYQDYRIMLEKEKLDAVFVETTTHARVRAMIHGMQAGCDIYGEKPISLTVAEGRVLANAVKRYRRVFQTGSQQRSMPINMHASRLVREGAIGKVHTVITCNFKGPKTWKPAEPQPEPIPAGLDWDHWCNQTELRPYYRELQFAWSDWDTYDGGGQVWGVTGWGTHSLDQAQCGLGLDDTGPVEIVPEESGPECRVTMRYANGVVLKLEGKNRGMEDLGAIFIGDKGRIEILRGDYTSDPKELRDNAPPVTPQGDRESIPHIANFFDCMRSRRKTNADVETGHRATTLCHLVNICRITQRKLRWNPQKESFVGDEAADRLLSRPRRQGYELPKIT